MQKWLARFSFSFVIVGAALFYRAYKLDEAGSGVAELWPYYIGAALSFGLGLAGIRARHSREI